LAREARPAIKVIAISLRPRSRVGGVPRMGYGVQVT
jgi:hypothetical protein